MPQSRSKFEFRQEASLSQRLADKYPEYIEYAGSDPQISESIAVLNVLGKIGFIDLKSKEWALMKALLNERRKAAFATSEKVNEISKMGMQMPKSDNVISFDEEKEK